MAVCGICLGILLVALMRPALAQDRGREIVPEVNVFARLSDRTRLYLLASLTSELTENVTDGEIGAHVDFTLKPILRARLREGDWERERYLWIRAGYVLSGGLDHRSDGSNERRGILETTARLPLPHEVWLVNRLRIDLRDIDDESSTRYRYRVTVERELTMGDTVWVPYAQAENFYDTRYDAWNRQLYQVGIEFVFGKTWRIEPYFTHQKDQRSASGNLNRMGLVLKYYW